MTAITQKTSNVLAVRTSKDTLLERALSVVWNVRHPLSPFCESLLPVPDRLTYQTQDNHRVTIERFPHAKGRGEPLLICTGPLIHSRILRLGKGEFLRGLQENGFDVYLFAHRGQRNAQAPKDNISNYSWNDILNHDLPCAIDAIKRYTKSSRIFLLGHGLGGLLTYSWLSMGGSRDLAGNITIDAPALYTPHNIPLRYTLLNKVLSQIQQYPTKTLAQLQAQRSPVFHPGLSPEKSRGILHHCLENISPNMVHQLTTWLKTGRFCSDTQYHLSTIRKCTLPKLLLAGAHEELSSYVSFTNERLTQGTYQKNTWKHLPFWEDAHQPIASIVSWSAHLRNHCWED